MNRRERIRLLNPGPVTLTPRVRQALAGPDLCHREPEFAALQTEVREGLASIYAGVENGYSAVLFTGSGTAAVEAMVGSLVPGGGKALVVENGVYGERMSAMLRAQGKQFETVHCEWTQAMDLARIEDKLLRDPQVSHVLAVHHETTTGRLNDLPALGTICRRRGVALMLDAVSSFAGEEIDFENWNVEACASTANKCLHGAPGIAFVLARTSALEQRFSEACSVYLDLQRNYREQHQGQPLFTPSVQILYALREALRELTDCGGWQQRHQHYAALSRQLRDGMKARGIQLLLPEESYSASLTSFLLPEKVPFQHLYDRLKEAGFVIYPGQHSLKAGIFRVAVMGDLGENDLAEFLTSFSAALPAS